MPEISKEQQILLLKAELAKRELARRSFADYLAYSHGASWKATKMSTYLANEVQRFLEQKTGNAYDILIIETPPQHGKMCADSTMVPTPNGWVRHGDLKPGDYVFDPKGRPIKVLAEIPQVEPATMLVTFADGAQVKVHPNHEWVVRERRRKGKVGVIETHIMKEKGLRMGAAGRGGRYMYSVDANVCVEYPEAEQRMDPYVFGLWLGDGTTTKPAITHHPNDIAVIEECVRRGYVVGNVCRHKGTGIDTTYFTHGRMTEELKGMGFGYHGCDAKHIPANYKQASVEQRLALLAGMIDSDGYVYQENGRVTISNINKTLIEDFAEVARSLGWRATIAGFEPIVSTSGVQGKHKTYQLTFNPDREIPTVLERKKIKKITPLKRNRAVVSIEMCEPEHGKCITVEGGVYLVTDHFVPTHNSMTITESLPAWYMGKHPDQRVIIASYNEEFAERFCRRNKEKVQLFGANLFKVGIGSINRSTEFELDYGGGRLLSRGIMSGITGNPANLIVIDDPVKNMQEADSPTYRNRVWTEWQASIKSRLQAGGKVIVIMTPWHEDDLAARMLATEPNVRLIRLPVEAGENDPLGRQPGDSLCPELGKDNAWLADFKRSYIHDPAGGGPRAWTALYMCSPRIEGGNLVHRDWWRTYDPDETKLFGTEVISVDAAFKDAETNDYVSIQVWGKLRNDYYLRYCLNQHLDFPSTVAAIRTVKQLYPRATTVLIEDKANGSAIIQTLQREMYCIPVQPIGGKVARVNAISAAIESGHVFVPDPAKAPWVNDFIDQFTAFPNGAHDDMVDAASQGLNRLIYFSGELAPPPIDDETELRFKAEEIAFNDPNVLFDPYRQQGWAM